MQKRQIYHAFWELSRERIKSNGHLCLTARKQFSAPKFIESNALSMGKLAAARSSYWEWYFIMAKAFASVDGISTICNNADAGLIEIGFQPEAIFIDEAGQVNLAAFATVVTTFTE